MSLWSNTDANTSAPKFVGIAQRVVQANGLVMYANTTPDVFVVGQNVGVFGVDTTEQAVSATTANHPQHSGWVLVKAGSGRRAGRFQTETLVAMGSMVNVAGGGSDGSATANDDTTFADA
jgi:hypothetical protein